MSDRFATWSVTPDAAWGPAVAIIADAVEADTVDFANQLTDEITAWMQANHRWQNRTGNAEAGLYSDVEHVIRQSINVLLSHGPAIEYNWFLEANPRYAVLGDAADHFWPVLVRGVTEIMRRYSS